jgi:hypothetical protein
VKSDCESDLGRAKKRVAKEEQELSKLESKRTDLVKIGGPIEDDYLSDMKKQGVTDINDMTEGYNEVKKGDNYFVLGIKANNFDSDAIDQLNKIDRYFIGYEIAERNYFVEKK